MPVKILAGIVVLLIIAALFFFRMPGISALLSSPAPAPAPEETAGVTEVIPAGTPSPGLTTLIPEPATTATTVPETPSPTPSPTKEIFCPSNLHQCGSGCTDITNDPANCGACGVSCPPGASCRVGRCLPACPPDQSTCYDGCHNLSTDSANCGVCGNLCPVGLVCNMSICSPPVTTVIPTYMG